MGSKSKAEEWAKERLKETGLTWSRERIWRWRLYDFWNHELGCAIEIDGPEHSPEADKKRDADDFKRSGILVLRVKNFNNQDMDNVIRDVMSLDSWLLRRERMGLLTDAQRKKFLYGTADGMPKKDRS